MIDLNEYDSLFQKMEDLIQGLTSAAPDKAVVDHSDENYIVVERRRDLYSSTIALADERDDTDTDLDFLRKTEDKIAAELLELTDLIRSGSNKGDRSTREMPEHSVCDGKVRSVRHKGKGSSELDKAIMKQLEEFLVSGPATIQDKRKNQVLGVEKMEQIDALRQISSQIQGSQDEVHIFQSNSHLDSLDSSEHDTRSADVKNHRSKQRTAQEETVELSILHDDGLGIEIDGSGNVHFERELKETYPLEFPGRSPAPPKSALSFVSRDPSMTSSSSDESSLVWLGER